MCALLPRRRGADATGRCGDGDAVAAKRKMSELTHLDQSGAAHMVDVSGKAITARQAIAHGRISMSVEARDALAQGWTKKGDVLAVARVAGIMGAKTKTELKHGRPPDRESGRHHG